MTPQSPSFDSLTSTPPPDQNRRAIVGSLWRFAANAVAFALIHLAILSICLWRFGVSNDDLVYHAAIAKYRRLAEAPPPRMLLVGGSNLLFGIDSRLIEAQTDYAPVNFGLHAGLRLGWLLDEAQAQVREGDLVVLSIEYLMLNAEAEEPELEAKLEILPGRPSPWLNFTWAQWRKLLDSGGLQQLGLKFRSAIRNIGRKSKPDRDSPAANMNRYGDLTLYHAEGAQLPAKNNDQQTLPPPDPARLRASIERINDFARRCRAKGAPVVYAAPPVPVSQFENNRQHAAEYDRALQQLNVPILLHPAQVVHDDRVFIGMSYHLHGHAVGQRTQQLIDAILKWERENPANRRKNRVPPPG